MEGSNRAVIDLLGRERISRGFALSAHRKSRWSSIFRAAGANGGLVRAVGSLDFLIAGYAMVNNATALATDQDFDHIARVTEADRVHRVLVVTLRRHERPRPRSGAAVGRLPQRERHLPRV